MKRFLPLTVAIVLLDDAVQMHGGNFSVAAISNVALALIIVAMVIWGFELQPPLWPRRAPVHLPNRALEVLLAAASIYELHFWLLPTRYPAWPAHIAFGIVAMLCVLAMLFAPLLLAIGALLILGGLVIAVTLSVLEPTPNIDVFIFHQHAWAALSAGHSPYGGSIPNIYGNLRFYSERFADLQNVFVGFPYPPLSLLLSLPALALGDPRYATLAAWVLTAIVAALTGRDRASLLAAALLLAFPRLFFVIDNTWTEPLVLLLFSLVLYSAARAPRWLGLALGLFLAAKQYDVLLLPLVFLLRPARAVWWQALLVAALVTLPLALTNPLGFWHDVVAFQFAQPFRDEALSFDNLFGWRAAWPAFVLFALATALALWRAPKTASGFALASGFVWLVFFAFNKQAFCNYYALVIGVLCLALSASSRAHPSPWPTAH